MEQKEKLIGIFVARAFEENNLNFIHAMHRIGKKQGYKLVIFRWIPALREIWK